VIVKAEDSIYIPDAFDLGSNDINNKFQIFSSSEDNIQSMSIFDRWGNLVYQSFDTWEWDGRMNNRELEQGPYVCRVEYLKRGLLTAKTVEILLLK